MSNPAQSSLDYRALIKLLNCQIGYKLLFGTLELTWNF